MLGPPRSHRAKGTLRIQIVRNVELFTDGSLRSVYDFVFGLRTLHRAQSDEQFRLVLLQTCYRALQEKVNVSLSKSKARLCIPTQRLQGVEYNIAKKYAFKGPPERPKTLVTELTSQPYVEAKIPAPTASSSLLTAADYTVARSASSDAGVFEYHVRISLPKLVRSLPLIRALNHARMLRRIRLCTSLGVLSLSQHPVGMI